MAHPSDLRFRPIPQVWRANLFRAVLEQYRATEIDTTATASWPPWTVPLEQFKPRLTFEGPSASWGYTDGCPHRRSGGHSRRDPRAGSA
jgi:hypothetical protein